VELKSGFANLERVKREQVSPEMVLRNIVTGRGEVKFWSLRKGLHPSAHHHPEEQISWVIKGKVEFRVGKDKRTCGPGDVIVVPGDVEHEGNFIEDTELVSIFLPSPAR
jgi:quercetin dioxygenase-like cupin family protein